MNEISQVPQFPWLSLTLLLPLAGALFCLLHGRRPEESRWLGLYEDVPWFSAVGVRYVLALDSIALVMVLLTCFLQIIAVLLTWRVKQNVGVFLALLLLMESGLLGIFLAYDLVLFYLFWEVALIPMFFIISFWGGEGRKKAALKFLAAFVC